jgi:membrane protein implicated in regulation of membrane protease activity
VALVVGVLLAIFVLDGPWEWVAVAGGGAIEIGEAWFWLRWTKRRRPEVGVEALVDAGGEMVDSEWARVRGELWQARSETLLHAGDRIRVRAVDGLTLVVERISRR